MHVLRVAALLDDAGDDVALLAGELAELHVVLGVAQPLQDDLLGGGRRDPAEALGRVVVLRDDVALLVGLGREHGDVAGLAVELDPRLRSGAPGVLWYAVSSACSIASTRMSKEISFSRSRARSSVMSMSMAQLLLRRLNSIWTLAFATSASATPPLGAVDVERGRVVVAAGDPAGERAAVAARDLDQPADVAPPVPRVGQRPVDPGRGDLEGVGLLAHHVGLVEQPGDLLGRLGDVVEGDAAVLVDGDPQQPPLAGGRELDGLEVEAHSSERGGEHPCKSVPGLVGAHGHPSCSAVVVLPTLGHGGEPLPMAPEGADAGLDRVVR